MNSPLLGKFEGILESLVTSMGIFSDFRKHQMAIATGQYADAMAETIRRFKGTPSEIGHKVRRAWEEMDAQIRMDVDPMYRKIDELVNAREVQRSAGTEHVPTGLFDEAGNALTREQEIFEKAYTADVMTNVTEIKSWAGELLERLNMESELVDETKLASTRSLLQKLSSAPNEVTFTGAQGARSTMLGIARDVTDPKVAGIAKSLSGKLDSAMVKSAEESGVPGLVKLVRDANAHWKNYSDTFRKTILASLMDPNIVPAEKVHRIFGAASLDDIKAITKVTPKDDLQRMKRRIVEDWLDEATDIEAGMERGGMDYLSQMSGAAPPPIQGTQLKKDQFTNAIRKFGDEKYKLMFDEAERTAIDSFARATSRINMYRKNTWLSVAMNSWLAMSVWNPSLESLGSTATILGISRRLANVVTSQEPTILGSVADVMRNLPRETSLQFLKAAVKTVFTEGGAQIINRFAKDVPSKNRQRIYATLGRLTYHLLQNTYDSPRMEDVVQHLSDKTPLQSGETVNLSYPPPPSLEELGEIPIR
jgi:predicted  nucleic acid-binding Zn-ribbon protein